MKLLAKINRIFDRTLDLGAIFASVLLGFILLAVVVDIVMIQFQDHAILWWLHDVIEYSLVYITFLIAAWVLRREGHIQIDLVLIRLNARTKAGVNIVTSILCAIACLVLTCLGVYTTWDLFHSGYLSGAILATPMYLVLAVVPVGTFLLFIQFLRRTYGYLRVRECHETRTTVADEP